MPRAFHIEAALGLFHKEASNLSRPAYPPAPKEPRLSIEFSGNFSDHVMEHPQHRDCLCVANYDPSHMNHVCERCGESFDDSEVNVQDKLVLDGAGRWKTETTYKCFSCVKRDVFG